MEVKGFITNLRKYNEGELIGEWIIFPIDDDELNEVFKRIGLNYYDDEEEYIDIGYEEYFFTDWETDINYYFNLGEYIDVDEVNKISEWVNSWNDEDMLEAALEVYGFDYIYDTDEDDYLYLPNIFNDEELGQYYIENCYSEILDKMGGLSTYFDYEKFGRDVRLETDGGFSENGWIERR